MNSSCAIYAPTIGVRSETFIRRHMCDLWPDRTVVIANNVDGPHVGHWQVSCPSLILDQVPIRGLIQRGVSALGRRFGSMPDQRHKKVSEFLKAHRVQVFMGEYLDVSLEWLDMCHEQGVRFFAHAHGYDVSMTLRDPKWQRAYLRYNQADGIVAMSEHCRRKLILLGIESSKIHSVPYGVDVPAEPYARLPHRDARCLAVGRMVAKKSPILLLDAFRRASEAFPRLHLDYIGTGDLLPAVRQYIRAFDMAEKVTLHGGQSSAFVQSLMREADIFLQHSMTDPDTGDEEGLPVAILEAMAQALPVISTRHAGIPEAVEEGGTGYLVNEGDSAAMGERIIALASDITLRQQMGISSWQRAKEHFTWEKERTNLLRVLNP